MLLAPLTLAGLASLAPLALAGAAGCLRLAVGRDEGRAEAPCKARRLDSCTNWLFSIAEGRPWAFAPVGFVVLPFDDGARVAIGVRTAPRRPHPPRGGARRMKRQWTTEELLDQWALEPGDKELLFHKEKTRRLGLFAQLAFYRRHRCFPDHRNEFAPSVLAHLAEQVGVPVTTLNAYRWHDRTGRRHRVWILKRLEVRRFDDAAKSAFQAWLMTEALPREPKAEALEEGINDWLARES
jgi:Domain of unknown function (DUF4158)